MPDGELNKNEGIQSENAANSNVSERKIIDESSYRFHSPKEKNPTVVGRGGDPFFKRINATKEQIDELMEETQVVQDWVQRETCNNVAIACLDSQNLREGYYLVKDGFGQYGRISLMGFKTPSGVEIPRLKVYGIDGEVLEVITGPMAIEEIAKRVSEYKSSQYEELPYSENEPVEQVYIEDYEGNKKS